MSQKYPGGFITKSPVAPSQGQASGIWTLDQAMQLKRQGIWPPVAPGAPTIGTATATGQTTATVAFTAPANNGGSVITSYTATSSPAGGTGTLVQSGSGTITVTGLSAQTSYTFTVRATNAIGQGSASAASNSITTFEAAPTVIGQAYGGGFYAGAISTTGNSVATHYLVVGPLSSAQLADTRWKTSDTTTAGTSSEINGPANSAAMNNGSHPAAQFCENLTIGGFSDWYMPARNELEICYFNLKPTTTANATNTGTNPNAVPARESNYTSGTPAQTSATIFRTGNAQAFGAVRYWSSTERNSETAWFRTFSTGGFGPYYNYFKTNFFTVRATRRVAV